MKFATDIFKAYDIRGKVGTELTPEVVEAVGRALADYLPKGVVAVGHDMRNDSSQLAAAMIAGLTKQGREVMDIGQVASDMIYYAVGKYDLAGGAMITASHNPGEYNGIKLTGQGVAPIGIESGLAQIRDNVAGDTFKPSSEQGGVTSKDIMDEWVQHTLELAGELKPLKVGADAGNGMAGPVIERLVAESPLEIEGLYLDPDGNFPNHPANPLVEENLADLQKLVQGKGLQIGVAFDGDGDRAFLVDEKGEVVTGSVLGALIAREMLELHPGATILYNAICSHIVPDTISALGGTAIKTKVGHSFIKAKMKETGAVFAAEHSGHFYFADNYRADSGLVAALKAFHILGQKDLPASEQFAPFRRRYTQSGEINSEVADAQKVLEALKAKYLDGQQDELDGLTVEYKDWWFNVRASNTEPVIRLNVESEDASVVKQKTEELLKLIRG